MRQETKCILIGLNYVTRIKFGIKILPVVKFNEILSVASTEDERNISIIFLAFKNDSTYLSICQVFQILK